MLRITLAAFLILMVLSTGCLGHGHVIDASYVPNHDNEFDFTSPPCDPAARPEVRDGDVLLRYLGVGGVYIEWNDSSLMTAPFFSNHCTLKVAFGKIAWNPRAIRQGLDGVPIDRVAAIVAGHSHYDHLADLPPILIDHAPDATLYVNRSGIKMLAAFDALDERTVELEPHAAQWIAIEGGDGPIPFRVMPVPSSHAGHFAGIHFARGEVKKPWTGSWEDRKLRAMREGAVFAFLIDLLAEDLETVRYRILYCDATAAAPAGIPSDELIDDRGVDLAILPMPSWFRVRDFPDALLERTRARHVLVIHHEDFLRPSSEPGRFVRTLTDARANGFMERLAEVMPPPDDPPAGPRPRTCGPCGERWTMPLPGEWMRFRAGE
jgi:L-ascorbate metabolism protein UlaG (beta-lactamase superfamily)